MDVCRKQEPMAFLLLANHRATYIPIVVPTLQGHVCSITFKDKVALLEAEVVPPGCLVVKVKL